jgi:hypothetical protein
LVAIQTVASWAVSKKHVDRIFTTTDIFTLTGKFKSDELAKVKGSIGISFLVRI